jgi:hypothetical protein
MGVVATRSPILNAGQVLLEPRIFWMVRSMGRYALQACTSSLMRVSMVESDADFIGIPWGRASP